MKKTELEIFKEIEEVEVAPDNEGEPLKTVKEVLPYFCGKVEDALKRLESIDNAIEICKKANEQKYVWIKESWGCCKEKFLDDLDYEVLKNRLYVSSRGMYYSFNLNEYGIWWALTKEELE